MIEKLTKAFHDWNFGRKMSRIGRAVDASPQLTALFNETVTEARALTQAVDEARARGEKRYMPLAYLFAVLVGRQDGDQKHARDMLLLNLMVMANRRPRTSVAENLQTLHDDFRSARAGLQQPQP